jgi:uncharacterized protein YbjT (DUF2867 family)
MLVITGASGHIGSKAAELLLGRGEQVRVVGRDAGHLRGLVRSGAEAAVGSLEDVDFLTTAFRGADGVFAMIPPNYGATDFRAYQNRIGANIVTAIRKSGVSHVVNLSSQGAELPAGTGPILGLRDQEERLNGLNGLNGINVVHLRPTYFMENLLMNIPLINQLGCAGSALRGDQKFAMIATRDIAARVAERLIRRDFVGTSTEDLLGPRDISMNEATTIIGTDIGWPELKYVQFPYSEAEKGMLTMGFTPDVARLFIEMSTALNEGLFATGRPRTAENTTPTTMEEFAEIFALAFEHARPAKAA